MASLPAIRDTLGDTRWPVFADRLLEHAGSMRGAQSTADQAQAAERLAAFLLEDEQVTALVLAYEPGEPSVTTSASDHRQHPLGFSEPAEVEQFDYNVARFFEGIVRPYGPSVRQPDQPGSHEAAPPSPAGAERDSAAID